MLFPDASLRARYDEGRLVSHLQQVLGEGRRLGDEALQTGLLVITKRIDTGSPWPLGNNPAGHYFRAKETDRWISNGDYPLWQVVRASTAAPTYFDPERITIAEEPGREPVVGEFIDGGASPFNNPALQALMYATLEGYRVGWKTGADRLLLVSVGTGMHDPSVSPSHVAAEGAVKSLLSLMDDCGALVETLMQWLSKSPTAHEIDRELGRLDDDLLGGKPLLTYQRYNVSLTQEDIRRLKPDVNKQTLESLPRMDEPDNLDILRQIGKLAADNQVKEDHFPPQFDLPSNCGPVKGPRRKYMKRTGALVSAIQLDLDTSGFSYRKWGGEQSCKKGDWIVNNGGDVYTVDCDTFTRTYRVETPGCYRKIAPVWAEVAARNGSIKTKEGVTGYQAGDYLVFNDEQGHDGYAVTAPSFKAMYEPAD